MLIRDILIKGLKTISHEATMLEAESVLKEFKIRHLPVIKDKKIVGMLSDRDVHRAMTVIMSSEDKPQSHIYKNKMVSEYMASPALKMKSSETVESLARDMIGRKVSSMIIEDETGTPIGIITSEDLLLVLIDLLQAQRTPLQLLKKFFKRL